MRSNQSILLLCNVMAALFLSVSTSSEALTGDGAQGVAGADWRNDQSFERPDSVGYRVGKI
jgi:hypothetical protein